MYPLDEIMPALPIVAEVRAPLATLGSGEISGATAVRAEFIGPLMPIKPTQTSGPAVL